MEQKPYLREWFIRNGREIGASVAALAMVCTAAYVRTEIIENDLPSNLSPQPGSSFPVTPRTTEPVALTAPSVPTPSSSITMETSTTSARAIMPAISLEKGPPSTGGMLIDKGHSWTVDCINPAGSNPNPASETNEVQLPNALNVRTSILGIPKDTVFFGEQTAPPFIGDNSISHGWAVKYDSSTNSHSVYKFIVRPQPGALITAEALGNLVAKPSLSELQTGLELDDKTMRFMVKADGRRMLFKILCK